MPPDQPPTTTSNLSEKQSREIAVNPANAARLDQIPSPFLNGVFDTIMDQYGDAITGALWETN